MRSEFVLAINQLCAERKLSPEVVMEAVEASLISAYRRNFGAAANIEVRMNPDTGDVRVFAAREVVDTVLDRKLQIGLDEARQIEPEIQLGETVLVESTPRDFGRIAAQTAKQVILQRIREAERDALYSTFADSAGEIAHGTIQSIDYHSKDLIVNIEGAEYELLEDLIRSNFISAIRMLQVQFHDFVDDAEPRMQAIQELLAGTHELTMQHRFVWENWKIQQEKLKQPHEIIKQTDHTSQRKKAG